MIFVGFLCYATNEIHEYWQKFISHDLVHFGEGSTIYEIQNEYLFIRTSFSKLDCKKVLIKAL